MTLFSATLQSSLETLDISLEAGAAALLEQHWQLVSEYNQKFNLTAIRDPEEAAQKHYADCLLLLPRLQKLAEAAQLPLLCGDIGSGAGFPGLVLALCCPQSHWLLLEASHKKCDFLRHCISRLQLTNVRVLALRAEQAGQEADLRASFHLLTARAVAPLAVLAEYTLPLLKEGGFFAALKGPALAEEEQAAAAALELLGATTAGREHFMLPGGQSRYLAYYQKTGPTPSKYPRRAGLPEKRPL